MAIDRMKHVTLLAPRRSADELVEWLQHRGVLHVENAAERFAEAAHDFQRPARPTEEVDARVRELQHLRDVFDEFGALERSVAELVVTLPTRVDEAERRRVLQEFDYRPVYEEAASVAEKFSRHQAEIASTREEIEDLEFWRALPLDPDHVRSLGRSVAWIVSMPERQWEALRADERAAELFAMQEIGRGRRDVHLCLIALRAEEEEAARLLRGYEFSRREVPQLDGSLEERIAALHEEVDWLEQDSESCRARIHELAGRARDAEILRGYWEAEREKIRAHNSALHGRRVCVLCGFVRTKDLPALEQALERDFPGVSLVQRDPTPEDAVPVSLTHGPLVRPMRVLVDMYGVPDYFGFDPTPYLSLSFLAFFGMCFADAVYGLALAAICWWLSRRAKGYEGPRNLMRLFMYCGVSTFIFGLLAGSWAADLHVRLFGESSPVTRTLNFFAVASPTEKAVQLLLLTFAIGIVNQLYGVILKGYGLWRRGRHLDAVLDAGLWLVMIPSFLLIIAPMFVELPEGLHRGAVRVGAITAVLLVLTQGRKEESVIGKAAVGVVSLYGVMGSYGCVSFVSDMLSYSRLLALGLATTVIGMSLNIIAEMLNIGGVVGIALFVLVVVLGHAVNFGLGMIGAFVHPLRLMFVEFFARFYESGGKPFRPLSLSTDSVLVESSLGKTVS